MTEHKPTLVRFTEHGTPGEVCMACSNPDQGLWVPVTECGEAAAVLPDDWFSDDYLLDFADYRRDEHEDLDEDPYADYEEEYARP